MSIEVESSFRFLHLREEDVQVYVSYDLQAIETLAANHPPEHTVIWRDPKGERHLLVICPRMEHMKKPQKKFKLGLAVLSRYGREQRARNPVLQQLNAAYLTDCLFTDINS